MHEYCKLLKIVFYKAFLLIIFSYDVYIYIYTETQSNRLCSCHWAQLVSELSDLATVNSQGDSFS